MLTFKCAAASLRVIQRPVEFSSNLITPYFYCSLLYTPFTEYGIVRPITTSHLDLFLQKR